MLILHILQQTACRCHVKKKKSGGANTCTRTVASNNDKVAPADPEHKHTHTQRLSPNSNPKMSCTDFAPLCNMAHIAHLHRLLGTVVSGVPGSSLRPHMKEESPPLRCTKLRTPAASKATLAPRVGANTHAREKKHSKLYNWNIFRFSQFRKFHKMS